MWLSISAKKNLNRSGMQFLLLKMRAMKAVSFIRFLTSACREWL